MKPEENLRKPASSHVIRAHRDALTTLAKEDGTDFTDALRGFVDSLPNAEYRAENGRVVWTIADYDFLNRETVPDTVNPSLWRQAQLNSIHGLFEVTTGVYQVRGMDMANMTIVEGETGIIVIDALTSIEGAEAALALYRKNRGNRPVKGLIITHTHADHWGGTLGVASEDAFKSGSTPLIAPDQFMENAVSENVIAGSAMRRRSQYQFGQRLPAGERGHVDNGLGKTFAVGRMGLVEPNDLIRKTGDTREIDGVTFEFQLAPDTEAPAEMHIFMPATGVLNLAENAVRNFHNLLPFRGAQVRNALNWTKYISEALQLWGDKASILIGQHHWPLWGNAEVIQYLEVQRDLYKFTHDQTLRMINNGMTPNEIAAELRLPRSIDEKWYARGYYGSIQHNAKAVYQQYIGWYDCVPAHLDPLPPVEAGKKMVTYLGGADAVVAKARSDFENGEYRWVAQILNHVVFADPNHLNARNLLADTYEQLGYIAECATWRNSFLFGAQELREGARSLEKPTAASKQTLAALTTEQLCDFLSVRLNGEIAEGERIKINLSFTDTDEEFVLNLQNSALTYVFGTQSAYADLSLTMTRHVFEQLLSRSLSFEDAIMAGQVLSRGNVMKFGELFRLFVQPSPNFAIVEPGA
ncbi:MAG: alkyl sulfatase dimerization domain-containing protein [Pseudomonadota bacterium]